MKKRTYLLLMLLFSGYIFAQEKTEYYQSFDHMRTGNEVMQEELKFDKHKITRALFQPSYSQGISGKALDLNENIPLRIPYAIEPEECPSYGEDHSFSIQVWIKTIKGARQGTPL